MRERSVTVGPSYGTFERDNNFTRSQIKVNILNIDVIRTALFCTDQRTYTVVGRWKFSSQVSRTINTCINAKCKIDYSSFALHARAKQ